MRLIVLGGSAAGANPGQGCSGYLVESGTTRIVLDLGPGTFIELRKHVDFRSLDAVVISHLHLDHVLDLLTMRYALAYNPVQPGRRLPLWLPPGGLAFLGRLAASLSRPGDSSFFSEFELGEYDPASPLRLGPLLLRFLPTVHYVPCWAMRVSNDADVDLLYTADTGPATEFLAFAAGAEVVVAEATAGGAAPQPPEQRGHLTPAEAGAIARGVGAEILVLSHLWAEHDPFASLRAAKAAFGGSVELATPGLQVSWGADDRD